MENQNSQIFSSLPRTTFIHKKILKSRPQTPPLIPRFLYKLFDIVTAPENQDIIEFIPSGDAFVVKNEALLANTILPAQFKHNNYSSFVRQLNMYGFKKIRNVDNQNEFRHKYFNQHCKNSLQKIQRKSQHKDSIPCNLQDQIQVMEIEKNFESLKHDLKEINHFTDNLKTVNQHFSESTIALTLQSMQLQKEMTDLRQSSQQWWRISTILESMLRQSIRQRPQNEKLFNVFQQDNQEQEQKTRDVLDVQHCPPSITQTNSI